MSSNQVADVASALVIMGFVLAVIAVIILAASGISRGRKIRTAGILLIGPIPIMFGTDKESVKLLVILSLIITAVVVALMLFTSLGGR